MDNGARAFVNPQSRLTVRAVHRKEFDITPSPMCITGGDYRYQHVQGGCEANGYLYTCMVSAGMNPTKCCIFKHDIASGKLVGHSDELELGHANDAAYNPDNNTIIVSLCDGTTRMAILDADTLELRDVVTLEGHVLCNIHYDPVSKIYAAAAVQCEKIYVYDSEFRLIRSFDAFMTPGEVVEYSMQGAITDGIYMYVLEWHGGRQWGELKGQGGATNETSSSHFNVFDLRTGEHAGVIDLHIPRETEYAVYKNGKFLIGCNNIRWNGLEVYEVEITSEE